QVKYMHIFLQAFYQLLCMELQLIKHHDLHCDNILIRQLAKPVTITLDINGPHRVKGAKPCSVNYPLRFPLIQFKTTWLVSIFDFDWGSTQSHPLIERNLRLDKGEICINRDICNNSSQNY